MSDDDDRRTGDTRPTGRPNVTLTWLPAHGEKLRWLPRHGDPLCILEWLSQTIVSAVALAPVYIAIVVTLILLTMWFGPPFGEVTWQ